MYDLITRFSRSQQISLAKKGYNAENKYLNQIDVVLAFSRSTNLPAGAEGPGAH